MPINENFTDALMRMRRKAQLQGRPLTQQETAGAVEGMALSASDRLAKAAAASQGQQQIDISRKGLEEQMLRNEQMLSLANKAMRNERYKNYITTGLTAPQVLNQSYKAGKELYGALAPAVAKVAPTILDTQRVVAEGLGNAEYLKGSADVVSEWIRGFGF